MEQEACICDDKDTTLYRVIASERQEIAKECHKHRGESNIADCECIIPSHQVICARRDIDVVKELLEYVTNINEIDKHGYTSSQAALLYEKEVAIIDELIKHQADISNDAGYFLAILSSVPNLEVLEELLIYGVITDYDLWRTSRLIHPLFSFKDAVKLILKYILLYSFNAAQTRKVSSDSSPKHDEGPPCKILHSYYEDCVLEVVQMKTIEVKDGLTLHDFVVMKKINIPLYHGTKSTQFITQAETLIASYPIYNNIISMKVKYALDRGLLLQKLKGMSMFSRDNLTDKTLALNADCMSVIIGYLPNEDLHHLLQAISISSPINNAPHVSTPALKTQEPEKGVSLASTCCSSATAQPDELDDFTFLKEKEILIRKDEPALRLLWNRTVCPQSKTCSTEKE